LLSALAFAPRDAVPIEAQEDPMRGSIGHRRVELNGGNSSAPRMNVSRGSRVESREPERGSGEDQVASAIRIPIRTPSMPPPSYARSEPTRSVRRQYSALAHQSSVDRQPVIPDGGLSPALQEFELAGNWFLAGRAISSRRKGRAAPGNSGRPRQICKRSICSRL
jgi:hypothetical protein